MSIQANDPRVPSEASAQSLPLGNFFGRRLAVSYSVPFAFAFVAGVIAIFASGPGNQDLIKASALACLVWVLGWGVQALCYGVFCNASNSFIEIGLIGVRWRSGQFTVKRTITVAAITLTALATLSVLFTLRGFYSGESLPEGTSPFAPPGLGLNTSDASMRLFGWLLFAQAVCQSVPLPMTLGLHLCAASIVLTGSKFTREQQSTRLKRVLMSASLLCVIIASWSLTHDALSLVPKWPFFLVLAFLLVKSASVSHSRNLIASLTRDLTLDERDFNEVKQDTDSILQRVRLFFVRRRLKKTLLKEHSEAVDAAKLDEILDRLHREGQQSLSSEDRSILQRVSENLKKQKPQH